MSVKHEQIIESLRQFADELEATPEHNRPMEYGIGGYQRKLFNDIGLMISVDVTNEPCLSAFDSSPQPLNPTPNASPEP